MKDAGFFCFLACYFVAFCLELARIRFKQNQILRALEAIVLSLGVVLHGVILYRNDLLQNNHLFTSASGLFFVIAFALAFVADYLTLVYSRAQFGIFFLPLVAIAVIAGFFAPDTAFSENVTCRWARAIHAIAFMLASLTSLVGTILGVMFFLQKNRLKRKISFANWSLPSLEWLGCATRHSTNTAVILLGVGVASGYYLKLFAGTEAAKFGRMDPLVIGATVLFLAALFIQLRLFWKKDADVNANDAWLVFACSLVLGILLLLAAFEGSEHWRSLVEETGPPAQSEISGETLEQSEAPDPLNVEIQ